ncbi:MAG: hypothetical protein V7632_4159, partial [Bradyrhizobium sp.]
SVMRHTNHGRRDVSAEPVVTVTALQAGDSATSLLARLTKTPERAAS